MKKSYGGVVINQDAEVLLREPKDHYDGYAWTFAKGEPSPGESVQESALREVLEETGVTARIVAEIPGVFRGSTSENKYFIMLPIEDTKEFDQKETQSVKWTTQGEAEELISKTTNPVGRIRDLKVLKAAFKLRERQKATRSKLE